MRRTLCRILPIIAIAAAALALSLRGLPDGKLHVWYLDVGQGDAILVQTPEGQQVLIDGGPKPAALLGEIGSLLPFWDRSIDLVILTHADADHLNGLMPLLERYRVPAVLDAAQSNGHDESVWADAVKAAGSRRTQAERGSRVKAGGAMLTVLNPAAGRSAESTDNNASVVVRLDYGDSSFLFTGDAEQLAEGEMLRSGLALQADVLKVAHHGSAASSSAQFLRQVSPSLAVIPVGAGNDFGHPHEDVLARLAGVPILRTDINGRVEVITDGSRLWSRAEK